MKIALLGIDRYTALVASAVAEDERHEISVVCGGGENAGELLTAHPAASREDQWENLLLGRGFDLLVVGASEDDRDLRCEQLRRFVQEGIPLVVVQPAAEAIVLHELAMIQHDTASRLAAWNPVLAHPAMQRLLAFFREAEDAEHAVSHIAFGRAVSNPNWRNVQMQLAQDAQCVRELIGPPNRVTALATKSGDDELRNLAVTFVGPHDAIAQWTLGNEDQLTVAGQRGQASWKITRDGRSRLILDSPTGHDEISWSETETQHARGRNVVAFLESVPGDDTTNFDHATRAVELAEAAHESNRRSRTIQLHYEEHSEQQTFKSMMAAGGCLTLLAVLCVLCGSIGIDSIGAPVRNNPWWRIWPVYLLAPVVLFLLAQTLWRVFASTSRTRQPPANRSESED